LNIVINPVDVRVKFYLNRAAESELLGRILMVKAFVFYDSKYGNTKLAAEKVAEGLRSRGVEINVGYVNTVSVQRAVDYDAIFLGAPNHMGRPSQTMKKFIKQLGALNLKDKKVAVFGTYAGKARPLDRSVKKMISMVREELPNLTLVSSSLSVHVKGVSGPVMDGELSKCVEFGTLIAAQLK
jgi:flavorubredoxin